MRLSTAFTFLERRHRMSNFNTTAFLEDAKKIHLNGGDTLPDTDVRRRLLAITLDGCTVDGEARVSMALD
jgi:hypothetical protein